MSRRAAMSIAVAWALALPLSAGAEQAQECGASYTVEQGDSLAVIAKRCGSSIEALITANPDLKDPARISIGQELALPGPSTPDQPDDADEEDAATEDASAEAAAAEDATVKDAGAKDAGAKDATAEDADAEGAGADDRSAAEAPEKAPADAMEAPEPASGDDTDSPEASTGDDGAEGASAEEGSEGSQDSPSAPAEPTADADGADGIEPDGERSKASEESPTSVTSEPADAPQAEDVGKPIEADGAVSEDDAALTGEDDASVTESTEPEPQLYVVQPGDSMARIAKQLDLKLDDLMEANEGIKPRALQPGQELRLPAANDADAPATRSVPALTDAAETPDDVPAKAAELAEPALPPLVLEGRIRRGTECPVLRTEDGATYSLVSQDYGFTPGDYVSIEGEAVEMSFCNKGKTVRVTSMRVESETEPR